MKPDWLDWALRLQALAQNGLTFCRDPFDIERYEQIRRIAAEMLAVRSNSDPAALESLFIAEMGYATPKLDVRGAAFSDDRILLVIERADSLWTLPGGWVDVGDSPGEAVVREVREESGYLTRAAKLAAVYDRTRHPHPPLAQHLYKLFFICDLIGGESGDSLETSDARFFAEDELPDLSINRVTAGQIARMFAHYRDPSLPTEFD